MEKLLERQREYFLSGATLKVSERKKALKALLAEITKRENILAEALMADLGKSTEEAYMTETGMVKAEIKHILRHIGKWTAPEKVRAPIAQFPASARVYARPLGCALIMAPWNYPVQLCLIPLASAIAAGCTAMIKPSAYAPHASRAVKELVSACLPPELACTVEGGRQENKKLLSMKFDKIFFTGSAEVGKIVMEAAAKNLTPVTLELGGKSPVIVTASADLRIAARRIVFGKLLNCGQTCVAPDHVLAEESIAEELCEYIAEEYEKMLPTELPHIINEKHFERLLGLSEGAPVFYRAGEPDRASLRIPFTVLYPASPCCPAMGEEIFGPILPVIPVKNADEAIALVRSRPHPLALYCFTGDMPLRERIMQELSFGGGCMNDTIVHLAVPGMPFGGVGGSGMDATHGKAGFDAFTHRQSILHRGIRPDIPMRYHPLKGKLGIIKKFL